MADFVDQNSGTEEAQSLAQTATDTATAGMQIDHSGEAQAAGDGKSAHGPSGSEATDEPAEAAHPPDAGTEVEIDASANGGETVAESESYAQDDINAAIAAIQVDASGDAGAAIELSPAVVPASEGVLTDSLETTEAADGREDFSGLDDEESEVAAASTYGGREGLVAVSEAEALAASTHGDSAATRDVSARKKNASKVPAGRQKTSGVRKKRFGLLAASAVILIGLAAFFGPDLLTKFTVKSTNHPPQASSSASTPVKTLPPPTRTMTKTPDPYDEKLHEVARLRADLLAKKDEIDRLKQFYRDGISELVEEVQQEITRKNLKKLSRALANKKIQLDLQSIQRRWAYIDELEKPSHWLHQGSEALLFLSRRAAIDLKMSTIADGIELTRHMRHLNAGLQKYQLAPDRLAIDMIDIRLRPIEDIWRTLGARNKAIAERAVAHGDQGIIDEICSGNTGRMAELTTLTIKASKCLAQTDTSELFLNRLTAMSPVAAKYLSNWKGQWLCLNGFHELRPEVARYLFRWQGSWISLNGLEDFPPRIGELLLSWEGRQLELMGLVYRPDQADRIGLQQLAHWQKAGGKLFVPERIGAEIAKFK